MFTPSEKTKDLKQSGIRAASVRCAELGGINLGQGVCDLPMDSRIKESAYKAIGGDKNLYSSYHGIAPLRDAIARKLTSYNKIDADPEKEVIVTHGSTGAFVCAVQTLFNPGDEVILFEPFYGYHKEILKLHGVNTKAVAMEGDTYGFSLDQLKSQINSQSKGIVICTPNNPSGKVFSRSELEDIGKLANQHDLYIITDEIYEYITYPGFDHISIASLPEFRDRTVTISGFSKTYNMTGWRLGYAHASAPIVERMGLVQDLLYVCPTTPLQHAGIEAMNLPEDYYLELKESYLKKRDQVVSALRDLGFRVPTPQGAYYLLADFSDLPFRDDQQAMDSLLTHAKVATVTGRSFYSEPSHGKSILRFCYALSEDKVMRALDQIGDYLKHYRD